MTLFFSKSPFDSTSIPKPKPDDDDGRYDGGSPVRRHPRSPKGSPGQGLPLPEPDRELVGV